MKKGLSKKSANWYEDTAWKICHVAHNQPKAIKRAYAAYEIPLRPFQQKKLKRAIETQYKYNLVFLGK